MKLRSFAVLLTCAVAGSAWAAQKSTSNITEAQVANYKRAAQAACREGGKKNGDPEAKVEAFCGCMLETLNKSMTPSEWRQVVTYSQNNQANEEREALKPHLSKLGACAPQPEPAAAPATPPAEAK
jgi:hypothetical protein